MGGLTNRKQPAGWRTRAVQVTILTALGLITLLFLLHSDDRQTTRTVRPPISARNTVEATAVPAASQGRAAPNLVTVLPNLTSREAIWSPTGESLLVQRADGIYLAHAPAFAPKLIGPFSFSNGFNGHPGIAWSPDGTQFAVAGIRETEDDNEPLDWTVYLESTDGRARDVIAGKVAAGPAPVYSIYPNVWLDDQTLAFDIDQVHTLWEPMALDTETGTVSNVLPQQATEEHYGGGSLLWSPDRQWITIQSAYPAPRSATLRIVSVATGEAWDVPLKEDTLYADIQGWLPDSSGLLYVPVQPGPNGQPHATESSLKLAHVVDHRTVTLAEGMNTDPSPHVSALPSPDGSIIALQGIVLGNCPLRSGLSGIPGHCVSLIDVETGALLSSAHFPVGRGYFDGPYGVKEWIDNDTVALVALKTTSPWRALWLMSNPLQPEPAMWQDDVPAADLMSVVASPDGQYAVVMSPTDGPAPNSYGWQARVYKIR